MLNIEKNELQNEGKFGYIDALRGLAIVGVVMIHTNQYGQATSAIPFLIANGRMGVQLFFVASAFTLFLSFKNRQGKEKAPTRNFFIRRFFRIAPMYYSIGIGYYLLQDGLGPRYWLGDEKVISIWNIISNFLFIHGVNPYWINSLVPGGWSITVEMMFYATVPFLISKIKTINHSIYFLLFSVLFSAILSTCIKKLGIFNPDQYLWHEFLFFYFPNQLPVFALGIFMYFLSNKTLEEISGKPLLILALAFLFQQLTGYNLFQSHVVFSFGFVMLGVALSRYPFFVFVNPIVNYLGKISFSMYLIHFAVLYWLTKFHCIDFVENGLINYLIRLIVVLSTTAVLSSITYTYIELPFQTIGKKIIKRLEDA